MKEAGLQGYAFELTIAMAILLKKLTDDEFETIKQGDLRSAVLTNMNGAINSSN